MTKKILVRSIFFGWESITQVKALKWARKMFCSITTGKTNFDKLQLINKRLKGIQFNEKELI